MLAACLGSVPAVALALHMHCLARSVARSVDRLEAVTIAVTICIRANCLKTRTNRLHPMQAISSFDGQPAAIRDSFDEGIHKSSARYADRIPVRHDAHISLLDSHGSCTYNVVKQR